MLETVQLPEVQLGGITRVIPQSQMPGAVKGVFQELMELYKSAGILFAGPEHALYRPLGDAMEVSVGVPMEELLPEFERIVAPATMALHVWVKGDFSGIPAAFDTLYGSLAEKGYGPGTYGREIYRLSPRDSELNICDVYADVVLANEG